jgi:hypothetical protein
MKWLCPNVQRWHFRTSDEDVRSRVASPASVGHIDRTKSASVVSLDFYRTRLRRRPDRNASSSSSFVRSFVRFNRPFRRIALSVRRVTRSCGRGRSWTRASSATRERSRTIADCGKGNFSPSVLGRAGGRGGWSRARGGRRVASRLGLESAFV